MHSLASRYARRSLIGVLALTGCATVQPPGSYQLSPGERYIQFQDSLARASGAEDYELLSVPRIRLVVPPVSYASTRYVEASFHLSEDAYVLVVAVDMDRRLRVLYPESPDESGFAARSSANHLTRFFAGFGGRTVGFSSYDARYEMSQRISPFGGSGLLLAIASDRPLQFDRLVGPDGSWDEQLLGQLILEKTLSSAAHALGHAVALTGQEFNTDYTTFDGRNTLGAYTSYASSNFGPCSGFYGNSYSGYAGYAFDVGYSAPSTRFIGFHQQGGIRFARYASGGGSCNAPVYYDVPVSTQPAPPRDTTGHDTTGTGMKPPRHPGAPRFPSVAGDGSRISQRFAPRDAHDGARERPFLAAGLRFRPPEQVPTNAMRPFGRLSPRDPSGFPSRREPASRETQRMRPGDARGSEPTFTRPVDREVREREQPRSEPAHTERMRPEPRSEPTRPEPRSEPASREPVHPAPAPVNPR